MGRARLARLHGIATSYEPSPGRSVQITGDTVVAVLAALGVDASTPQAVRSALAAYEDRAVRALLPAPSSPAPAGRPTSRISPKAPSCGSRPRAGRP